jgi:serine protease Do
MRNRCSASFILLLACIAAQNASGEADEEIVGLVARQAEEELMQAVRKASAAFVFIGAGSGVVVSADGYILTNHHVIGERRQYAVRLHSLDDLRICDVIGLDPVGDLALLKVRDGKELPHVEFGDMSQVFIGQTVLAIGDPYRLAEDDGPPAVSVGIISNLHRYHDDYSDAIQTDAAVNPGNSGGPLLTADGKLIGITGQIVSRFDSKANTGIGYAIPVDQILRFYPLLKEAGGGIVYHGDLPQGMTFISRTDDAQVACVEKVQMGSFADKAGFKPGDRILSVDGRRIHNYARLEGMVRSYPENAVLEFKLDRGGKEHTLKVMLPRYAISNTPVTIAAIGVRVRPSKAGSGLVVATVVAGAPAAKAGMQVNDLIISVEGNAPSTDWSQILNAKKPGEALVISIRRDNEAGEPVRLALEVILDDHKR